MWRDGVRQYMLQGIRHYSRVSPPPPTCSEPVIRVSNNIAHLGRPKQAPKPRQLLSLPPFPDHPLPGKDSSTHVTAISWVKYYFDERPNSVIQSHFNKGLVQVECLDSKGSSIWSEGQTKPMRKDSAIIVLNKPPRLPVKGNLPVHNSMDALAAAALSYEYDDGPRLVHRLDTENSGLHVMGRTKESIAYLHWLFSDINRAKSSSKAWNDACDSTYQRYWALVIGSPKEKEGLICALSFKGLEASQEAVTEYRVLGPMINGCSWIELCPHTSRKHQLRVHCAEALGTPIVGDYKYGWFVHRRWQQMPRVDFEPTTGKPYKLRRPEGLDIQKGSVLSKVPLLHLHCRELVLPNIEKFLELHELKSENHQRSPKHCPKPDLLRFVASMPSHMKISWNLMSSYLV
ncbi:pseudouridine synthase family protein [Actinidia rufa]|uniref:Pseudouridine synthase family protein n=1 Tax=Actinidia rufa TaxID=165716 RepID=A0A7J0FM14_9ERIC|nr:pseudouridine synthase family protein [Actinidia rufa]